MGEVPYEVGLTWSDWVMIRLIERFMLASLLGWVSIDMDSFISDCVIIKG